VSAGSRQQAAGSRQQAVGSRQQAAGSRQQAAGGGGEGAGEGVCGWGMVGGEVWGGWCGCNGTLGAGRKCGCIDRVVSLANIVGTLLQWLGNVCVSCCSGCSG
jgi:hypothetical protein